MRRTYLLKIAFIAILSSIIISVSAQPRKARKYVKPRKHYPHYRYERVPHRGHQYKALPKSTFVYSHSGVKYHYHAGVYYRPYGKKYVVVRAPIGIKVRTLPGHRVRIVYSGREYFYYYGTFYLKSIDDYYITVDPPKGVWVNALPFGYDKVMINGNAYYKFDGVYYRAIVDDAGEVWYEVVGKK